MNSRKLPFFNHILQPLNQTNNEGLDLLLFVLAAYLKEVKMLSFHFQTQLMILLFQSSLIIL
jgi:hypothetical protein